MRFDARIFTTEKIAKILDVPEWRVVRFAQVKTYGIRPALADAAGPGSRRLYNLENLCEMALATWLVQAGLRIQVIARVLKQIRQKGGLSDLLVLDPKQRETAYLGVLRKHKGEVSRQDAIWIHGWSELENAFRKDVEASLLVIPVGLRFIALERRLHSELEQIVGGLIQ